MAKRNLLWTACALCSLLAFAGCTPNGNSSGGSAAPQQDPVMAQQGGNSPYSNPGMGAPMYLNLRGPDPVPANGDIRLDLEVVVHEPLAAPVTLQVQVPPGAQVIAGAPVETIHLQQRGSMYRQYVVRTNGPLQGPIFVTADAVEANGAYGLHAKKQYPAAQPTVIQPSHARPPMARPPTAPPRRQ